ncbi:MAG: hypothetical protein JOY82_20940 [Streptosporangiaceae bacterium]|nr:hypothetical protein [Streptosporangiaceae bacterium]MBV9856951.1 hypothetical protein [Streptosporangiaceae bacterium]
MGDLVSAAVAELYAGDPDEFTERRKALAADARAAGDAAAAKQIAALRKPTRAAWVVNKLVRAAPDAPARLAALAAALRAAERSMDGAQLRELSAERGPLLDDLTRQAFGAAGLTDPPAGLREEVTGTLSAAIADPEVAARLAAGTLTRAERWAGFGVPPEAALTLVPPVADRPQAPDRDRIPDRTGAGGRTQAPIRAAPEPAAPGSRTPRRAGPRGRAEHAEELNRRRQEIKDAERELANAVTIADAAGEAEERLEDTVRELEGRLTRARNELAGARRRARNAERAQRSAQQALDRLRR